MYKSLGTRPVHAFAKININYRQNYGDSPKNYSHAQATYKYITEVGKGYGSSCIDSGYKLSPENSKGTFHVHKSFGGLGDD